MKNILLIVSLVAVSCSCHGTDDMKEDYGKQKPKEWVLVWSDDFNGNSVNERVWSRIPRGTAEWQNTQSSDDRCYEMRDGCIVLKGIVNDDTDKDPSPYLTGGIWSQDKKAFGPGRIEVRAKLQAAQGAWPAIWLLPYFRDVPENYWPYGGEIDIMERFGYDSRVSQTVHSNYTYNLGHKTDPVHTGKADFDHSGFNTYGVDIHKDSVVFYVNGIRNFAYPRVEAASDDGQFPYYKPMFLIIDMQLGGSWSGGTVDPADLPVEMEVDWVKYYEWK